MKKIFLLFSILVFFVSVNAADINSDVYFNKKIRITESTKFAVLPFELTASWAQNPGEKAVKKSIEEKNMEKFELSLLNAGATVIERQKLDKLINEMSLSSTGLTEADSIKLGKLLSADIIVLGTIPLWSFHQNINKGFIEILIKGIVVETGEISFKAVFDSKISTTNDDFRYDMAQLETKAYKIIGEKIRESVKK